LAGCSAEGGSVVRFPFYLPGARRRIALAPAIPRYCSGNEKFQTDNREPVNWKSLKRWPVVPPKADQLSVLH
jgi:hypothetical protein